MLSKDDQAAIHQAVKEAEHKSTGELACVVAPASDAYSSYLFLFGFGLGSVLGFGVWLAHMPMSYSLFFAIQMMCIVAISMLPGLRSLFLKLVPKRLKHHRAAHRAYEEYVIASRHAPAGAPFVLLYLSLAERYAHIFSNRTARAFISDEEWEQALQNLLAGIKSAGVRDATLSAVHQASELLALHFPKGAIALKMR